MLSLDRRDILFKEAGAENLSRIISEFAADESRCDGYAA
jgi:hypothetical protein